MILSALMMTSSLLVSNVSLTNFAMPACPFRVADDSQESHTPTETDHAHCVGGRFVNRYLGVSTGAGARSAAHFCRRPAPQLKCLVSLLMISRSPSAYS